MTWGAHSSMPGAFPPEPSSQPHSNGHVPSTSRGERVALHPPRLSRAFRLWIRQTFFHRPSTGSSVGWSDDSGYDSWSLSSSSGSEKVVFEHPTHGNPGLSICDTDDYLTVQNPNPHTGEMSPSVLSLVSERTEPPNSANGSTEVVDARAKVKQSLRKDRVLRWRLLGKELPPAPTKTETLPPRPPPVTVEDEEEPPAALDSATQPLQAQPPPDHYAAFDPDHLRMPGALTITPPAKMVTNGGTDAISTWVTEESRRVFELPAGPLTPGDGPPESQAAAPAGPRLMRSQTKSRSQVPTLARTRSYTSYDPREAFGAQSRSRVLGPRHPWERPANTTAPRRACSIPRKPVAESYMALPPPAPHGPDDIIRPIPPAASPIEAEYAALPPPPPPHRYDAGRPYHRGEWNASSRPRLDTPPSSLFGGSDSPLTAPIPVMSGPGPQRSEPESDIRHHATQTRASAVGTFKRHPIQPSFETPSVRAQTRLNGTGVQRLVITTGKPRQPGDDKAKTAAADTQAAPSNGTIHPRVQETGPPAEKKPQATAATPSREKQPKTTTGSRSIRKKLTKTDPTSKARAAVSPAAKPGATKTATAATSTTLKSSPARATPVIPTAVTKPAPNAKNRTATSSAGSKTAATGAKDASFAAQRAAALAALREQHANHCSVGKHAAAGAARPAAQEGVEPVEVPEESAGQDETPLIAVRVSRRAVVMALQALAVVWAVTAGWYMLGVVGRGLMVVLWPVWWVLKGIAMVGGCVRGGGWRG